LEAGEGQPTARALRLAHRLQACQDAQALWYLRSDLMQELSARLGEREARRRLDALSEQFDGLLPLGLTAGHAARSRQAHRTASP
ncbi:MAG: hypothetical protein JWQ72_969, partial [Polaromonas sp.]|nr:hypothetical protein [Polaromonas sp.]